MEVCEASLNDGGRGPSENESMLGKFKRKWLNLRCELPAPDKCCNCLPLRRGFLTLAYIKLVLSVALMLGLLSFVFIIHLFTSGEETSSIVVSWMAIFIDFVDVVVGIYIIISAHKKNIILMEIYYKYSIYVFVLLTVLCCVFYIVVDHVMSIFVFVSLLILIFVLQFYIILMVRSEVLKLRSNAQFQFLNNEAELQCTYVNEVNSV